LLIDRREQHAMFLRVLLKSDTLGIEVNFEALRIEKRCHSCRYQIAKEQTAKQIPAEPDSFCGTTTRWAEAEPT
jgi:hypothetical protein